MSEIIEEDTTIKIPDIRFNLSDDLPILHLEECKEISGKDLFHIYIYLEKYLCSLPNAIKTKDGELLGWKDNQENLISHK